MAKSCSLWFSALLCLLLFPAIAIAAEDFGEWSWFAPVEIHGDNKYKAVFLTEEVYEYASDNLTDLRLVESTGSQVPYYIRSGYTLHQQSETRMQARLEESFQAGDDSYFDYAVQSEVNTDPVGNKLVFTLPDRNFLKYCEVYGSYDGIKWQYVTKDYLYRVDGRQKNELSLGNTKKFSHYRIRLLSNTEGLALGRLELVANRDSSELARYEQVAGLKYEIRTQNRETVVIISNPHKLKIKRLVFDVDGNFQRAYGVYSDGKAAYPLQTGELYSLRFAGVDIAGKAITLNAPLPAPAITIKIDNRDDRPLVIKEIQAEYYIDKLVFPDMGNMPYRLYFGNAKAQSPAYELQLQQKYIEQEQQDLCTLQAAVANGRHAALMIKGDYLFNAAIVLVSLLLIAMLISKLNLRKRGEKS